MPRVNEERVVTEQQFQREVNAAIADTENEIFTEAMGDEQLDNDGDNSLEEMGEGLEGDELDEEDVREDVDTEVDEDADEEVEGDDEDDEDRADERRDDREEDRADRRRDDRDSDRSRRESRAREEDERVDQRRRDREDRGDDYDRRETRGRERDYDRDERRGFVPAWRQRQEAQRRRESEGEAESLRARLAVAEARIQDLNTRQNAGNTAPRQDVEPDMFADPEGWKAWNRRQMADEAARIADQRIQGYAQQTQQQMNDRVNASFHNAATRPGLAGLEFNAAYQTLTSLDPQNPRNRATVQAIFHAPDPARALADWFEEEGYAREFRADIAEDLNGGRRRSRGRDRDERDDNERDTRRRDTRGRYDREDDRGRRGEPRHEFRRRFVPSLNGAAGGGSATRVNDPEMLDNSEDSVFRYATR